MDFQASGEHGPKLTDWANEPNFIQIHQDFQLAKPGHDAQMIRIQHWNDLMAAKGKAAPPKVKGRSQVQPKLIRRQAEWRYSALTEPFLSSQKLWKVSPVTWEDGPAAKQNELVLNWQFRTKLNKVKFIDDMVRADVDEGTVVLRLGWCRNTVMVKEDAPVWEHRVPEHPEYLQMFQQALQMRNEDPHSYNDQAPPELKAAIEFYDESQQVTEAVKTGTQKVDVEKVVENRPTVEVLNPQNFYIDPSCNGDIDKALFAIVSFETNQAELKKNPKRYKNLDKVNWETATPITNQDHATTTERDGQNFRDVLRKRVVAYEYWGFYDIHNTGELVPIVVTWIGQTIIRMERNPFPDQKLPFVVVPYLPVKRDLFGEPDAEFLEDNQKILGAVTRGMIDLLGRSANSQRGMAKGMLDPLNKRRYENGEDYEFNPTVSPNAGVVEHKFPELPQSAMLMLNLQNQEAEALTGVKSFGGGMSGEAYGDVAAGIRGVLDAASKREMAILRRLAQGMKQIGEKLIAMNAVFLSEQEVIRVTNAPFVQPSPPQKDGDADDQANPNLGHNGGPKLDGDDDDSQFVTVNRDDLVGDFDLEVDISTAEVDNAKAQDLAFMLQTMGPNMDPSFSIMILAEIADLKRMPELAHKLRTFQPKPDPIKEQLQQIAVQEAQAKVEKLKSEAALNYAQAKNLGAQADKTNLDYVEQETGTAHARDMERDGAQARANQDLEVTKAIVAPRKQANGQDSKPNIEAAVGWNTVSRAQDNVQPAIPAAQQPLTTA